MGRKTFYTIIAVGLSAIFVYTVICIFVLKDMGIRTIQTARLKDLIAVSIIVYETLYATKTIRIICISLFPVAIIGFLFRIMHWPGGLLLFLGSILTVITLLLVNAVKSDKNRVDKIIVLIYPLSRFIFMTTSIYRLPVFWWTFDLIIIGLTAMFLCARLAGRKLSAPHNL